MESSDKEHASGAAEESAPEPGSTDAARPHYICDRCGFEMVEQHCKVVCLNCGARWDCSDLSIYTE